MHKTIRRLLDDASGRSEQVIVINLDVRDFSAFSQKEESPNAAMFIKRVYIKLLDDYFSEVSFFKPTGDGLLLIIPYQEKNLQEVARKVVDVSLKALKDFGSFCASDPIINFKVPTKIGIGVSRGIACCLSSKGKTIDYSGRVLNLASRLMDLARPSGVVFDDSFVIGLLTDEQIKLFQKETVYIKGISDGGPVGVWYTKDLTAIPDSYKKPLTKIYWETEKRNLTLRDIKNLGTSFWHPLKKEPSDPSKITVTITHPLIIRGKMKKGFLGFFTFSEFGYFLNHGKPEVRLQFDSLAKTLEVKSIKPGWEVSIEISYPL